jgi:hypothetical protein
LVVCYNKSIVGYIAGTDILLMLYLFILNLDTLTAAKILLIIIFLSNGIVSFCQSKIDSLLGKIDPQKWSASIEKKLGKLEDRIVAKGRQTLYRLQKQETKLKRKLSAVDSGAENIFSNAQQKYQQLNNKLNNKDSVAGGRLSGEYLPYLDSLKGSLSFLNDSKKLLSATESAKVSDALNQFNQFQNRLQQADAIKQFIRERKQQLSELLSRYTSLPGSIKKTLAKYNREAYYYSQQIREFKEIFYEPDKLLRKSLTVLNKLPAFQQFMKEHSELGSLFTIPANYNSALAIAGLQTKAQVQQIITNQLGGSANAGQIFSQQVQAAQSRLDQFKQKLNSLGSGSGDIDMPDFKFNPQRTKTFFKRLEYGTNIGSTKSSLVFPSTTDISLMVGYRIDDKKTAGIGIGGKIGWGKDIRHIDITGQGLNFRSFIDIKIKNSFYASGGFEYNYQKPFSEIQRLYQLDDWNKSGLIGITKIVSLHSPKRGAGGGFFKKTKIQLLWDILNAIEKRTQVSQSIKFRVGYNF